MQSAPSVRPRAGPRRAARGAWQSAALVLADTLLVNGAFLAAYWLRYILGIGGEVAEFFFVPLRAYLPLEATLTVLLLLCYGIGGLYRNEGRRPLSEELGLILSTTSFGFMAFIVFVFLSHRFGYSRGLFFMAWALSVAALFSARAALRLLILYRRQRGLGLKRVLVVGSNPLSKAVMHVITTEPGTDYQLIGYVAEDQLSEDMGRFIERGHLRNLQQVILEHEVEEVIVAMPAASRDLVTAVAELCRRCGSGFKIVPDLYELSLSRVDLNNIRGIPLIGLRESTIRGFNGAVKRAMDMAGASLGLLCLAPLWALVALANRLDSPGPVLFRQARLGRGGCLFHVYKFRSMRVGAEDEQEQLSAFNEARGPLFKMRNDPRVTRVGRLLRRTSLDELPQLLNVLRGEMSLVGPRPPTPAEVEQYEPWQRQRLEVSPGMTGLWQVSGRSELPFDEMVMLDIYYIDNWSLSLDLQILLRTIPAVLRGKGAF